MILMDFWISGFVVLCSGSRNCTLQNNQLKSIYWFLVEKEESKWHRSLCEVSRKYITDVVQGHTRRQKVNVLTCWNFVQQYHLLMTITIKVVERYTSLDPIMSLECFHRISTKRLTTRFAKIYFHPFIKMSRQQHQCLSLWISTFRSLYQVYSLVL